MKKTIQLSDYEPRRKQHIYELDHCSGCGRTIADNESYFELELDEGRIIRHIALCEACDAESQEYIDY